MVMGAALAIVRAGYGGSASLVDVAVVRAVDSPKRVVSAPAVLAVVVLEIRQQGRTELLMAGTGL